MKQIIIAIYIVGILLFTYSCDDFLTERSYSSISDDNFYESANDALAGLNAVYASFCGYYGGNVYGHGTISADLANSGEGTGGINELDINVTDFQGFWGSEYTTINYANTVLYYVPEINMDDDLKARYLGEAKFLRALSYFTLVVSFGDVPLITEPTLNEDNNYLPRTDKGQVCDQIIADLLDAIDVLPESYGSSETGRVTKGAAQAILARVYLTLEEWQNARDMAQNVISSGNYSLFPDFRDVFDVENENGQEHIFSIQYMANTGVASSFTSSYASRNPNILFGGLRAGSAVAAEQDFYDGYPEHYRKFITMVDSFPNQYYPEISVANGAEEGKCLAGPSCMKFWDPNLTANSQGDANWPVVRYAEVLLIFAEAENEVNGPTTDAYDAINAVRKRGRDSNGDGIDDPDDEALLPDLSGLSQDGFRQAAWRERELELCFEGHQRWDLLREGRFMEAMTANGKNPQEKHLLFPIPLAEIQANPNLTQNPGYSE